MLGAPESVPPESAPAEGFPTMALFCDWDPAALTAQLQALRAEQNFCEQTPLCLHNRKLVGGATALVKACDSDQLLEVSREALARADCAWGKQLCCAADARWAPCGCPFWAFDERRPVVLAVCRALASGAFALTEGVTMEEVERVCGEIGLALRAVACITQGDPKRRKIVKPQVLGRTLDWKAGLRELALRTCFFSSKAHANVWSSDPLCPTMDVMLWAPSMLDSPLVHLCQVQKYLRESSPPAASQFTSAFHTFTVKAFASAPLEGKFCAQHGCWLLAQLLANESLTLESRDPEQNVKELARLAPCAVHHLIGLLLGNTVMRVLLPNLRAFLCKLKDTQVAPQGGVKARELHESSNGATRLEQDAHDVDQLALMKRVPDWFELTKDLPCVSDWWWRTPPNQLYKNTQPTTAQAVTDAYSIVNDKSRLWAKQLIALDKDGASVQQVEAILLRASLTSNLTACMFVLSHAISMNVTCCVDTFRRSQRSIDYFCEQVGAASGMKIAVKCQRSSDLYKPASQVGTGSYGMRSEGYGLYLPSWDPRPQQDVVYQRFSIMLELDSTAGANGTEEASGAEAAGDSGDSGATSVLGAAGDSGAAGDQGAAGGL
jgi:hypothetical protein